MVNLLKAKNMQKVPEIKCGCSPIFDNLCDVYPHYCDVLHLLEHHAISADRFLYTMEDTAESAAQKLLPEQKHKIRTLIEHQPSECTPYIQELLARFHTQKITFSEYRNIMTELLFLLQEILYEQNISFSALSFIEETELFTLARQILLCEHLDEMCLHLYGRLAEQQQKKKDSMEPIDHVLLNFIDNHLSDISLTVLADAVGMNQNYLSQYFKKHFGISFIDYVTKKKIDKAKDMLVHTNLTCKAIGEELGWHDPNVFTRVFKKAESLTPSEYRRSHK